MSTTRTSESSVSDFIQRWQPSGSAERGNFQSFAKELCNLLAVPQPDPQRPNDRDNAYVFERSVHFDDGDGTQSTGWIDLYKRGCFVMEASRAPTPTTPPAGSSPSPVVPNSEIRRNVPLRMSLGA